MARYFLHISYIGSSFHGWQRQETANSVQAEIEKVLSTVLRHSCPITGCGRTDTGVHATQYFAHFDTAVDIQSADYVFKFNSILPDDIAIHEIIAVSDSAHARFDAEMRQYTYRIHIGKNPFEQHHSVQLSHRLDMALMNQAGQLLLDTKDFTSFAKLHSDVKTNICDVQAAMWTESDNTYTFIIEADRYLRNMVRAIVGTMMEVGRRKCSIDEFQEIIRSLDRSAAGTSAPAVGLALSKVEYPYLQRP